MSIKWDYKETLQRYVHKLFKIRKIYYSFKMLTKKTNVITNGKYQTHSKIVIENPPIQYVFTSNL